MECSILWGYHLLLFEYGGGYHHTCEGYHQYLEMFSTVGEYRILLFEYSGGIS